MIAAVSESAGLHRTQAQKVESNDGNQKPIPNFESEVSMMMHEFKSTVRWWKLPSLEMVKNWLLGEYQARINRRANNGSHYRR